MNLQEIIEQKDWWYLKDHNYIMNSDWVNQYMEPAPYPAFIWWDDYKFKTPRLYFHIAIREHTKERIETAKNDIGKFRYTVMIAGANSGVPLPIEIWEQFGSPWKSGTSCYIDCFYFGEKYKEYEESYNGKHPGTKSTIAKGFNNLEEAKEFAETWRVKVIEDHKKHIEIDRQIMKIIDELKLKGE